MDLKSGFIEIYNKLIINIIKLVRVIIFLASYGLFRYSFGLFGAPYYTLCSQCCFNKLSDYYKIKNVVISFLCISFHDGFALLLSVVHCSLGSLSFIVARNNHIISFVQLADPVRLSCCCCINRLLL